MTGGRVKEKVVAVAVVDKEYEFVHLLEGHIIITPDDGDPVSVKAGDTFVVESNFSGTWQIIEAVRKYFDVKLN